MSFFSHFGKKDFWNELYQFDDLLDFDWFESWEGIKDVVTPYLNKSTEPKILNVGCGNSKLSEHIFMDGYTFVMSIDFSSKLVDALQKRYSKMPNTFRFLNMDCCDMDFVDECFTHVIDKGTLDSILSEYRSTENADRYLEEVVRVLKPFGVFICCSYRSLEHRLKYLGKVSIFGFSKISKTGISKCTEFIKKTSNLQKIESKLSLCLRM